MGPAESGNDECWRGIEIAAPALNVALRASARCVIVESANESRGKKAGELLRGRRSVQCHGEAIEVIPAFPRAELVSGRLKRGEGLPAPELLVVDAVAAFDFPVLLGT